MRFNYYFKSLEKKLRLGFIPCSGRNFLGTICVHHKGGQSKKKSYYIDFFRNINCFGFVIKIFKTPFFSSFLGFIVYQNGLSNYVLLADNVSVGSKIFMGRFFDQNKLNSSSLIGSSVPVSTVNLFSLVSNVEIIPFGGGIISRAAGTGLLLTSKIDNNKVLLKSKSGWNFLLSNKCMVSLGVCSNLLYCFKRLNKAGFVRALGIRPSVRGVAMNPCDHPHGGGEGKKSPLVSAKSPWGWLTKGTPSKKKISEKIRKKSKKVIR